MHLTMLLVLKLFVVDADAPYNAIGTEIFVVDADAPYNAIGTETFCRRHRYT